MDFISVMKTVVVDRATDFNGRSDRPEYWWFCLYATLIAKNGPSKTITYYMVQTVQCKFESPMYSFYPFRLYFLCGNEISHESGLF